MAVLTQGEEAVYRGMTRQRLARKIEEDAQAGILYPQIPDAGAVATPVMVAGRH